MSKRRKSIVGLQIESDAIHAASVDVDGTLQVREHVAAALEPGIVREGEVVDPIGLASVLRTLFADHPSLGKDVRIGIANQKIIVRLIELPPITDEKQLAAAVSFQAADELPMPLDTAVLDYHSLGIIETPGGPRTQVVLVAARRDMVEAVLAAVEGAGLRTAGIDLASFAMVRALAPAEPSETAVLYVSIGGLTNLAIAQGQECRFTRVVGSGVPALVDQLAARSAISNQMAEEVLWAVGLTDAPALEGVDEVITSYARSVLQEGARRMASDVRTTVAFHAAESGLRVESCVLTGSALDIPGFAEAFERELALPVRIGQLPRSDGGGTSSAAVAAGLAVEEAVR